MTADIRAVQSHYLMQINLFYDAPSPPDGLFDELLAIPNIDSDISTRSFLSLVRSAPSNLTSGTR